MSGLPRGATVRRDAGLYGYERALRRVGLGPVAGVDEAGRGACAGPLVAAAAILLETSLSYLQLGVRPPDVSLGLIISDNQSAFQTRPWLFWWPATFIVLLALLVNFVGDGLRDAFDPRQKRFSRRRTKERASS